MCKISVIIPVYNVEEYLSKCLDSILNQSLKEIEIICIDDGSTDGCPEILDRYSKTDERILVIHKANEGCGKAKNVGLDIASGEYVAFVESDDWLLSDMFEILYDAAIHYDVEFVKMDYYWVWEKHDYFIYRNMLPSNLEKYYNKIVDHNNLDVLLADNAHWSGIYKLKFLREQNVRYNESKGASYQDHGFWIQVSLLCN